MCRKAPSQGRFPEWFGLLCASPIRNRVAMEAAISLLFVFQPNSNPSRENLNSFLRQPNIDDFYCTSGNP